MKKNIIIYILILTNLIMGIVVFHYKSNDSNTRKNEIQIVYNFKGENQNWKLYNGLEVLSDYKSYFDAGILEYIGTNGRNIKNLTLEIRSENLIIFSTEFSSNGQYNLIESKKLPLGQELAEDKKIMIHENIEKKKYFVDITYVYDNDQKVKETFEIKGEYINL